MKGFLAVCVFFGMFAGVVGGGLFMTFFAVRHLALPEDVENVVLCLGAVASLFLAGWLMQRLHAMVQRQF